MLFTKLITIPVASLILAGSGVGDCYAPKPLFGFKATAAKTKYNISESASALTGFHGGTGGGITLGLAYSALYHEGEYEYSYTQQNGNYCVAIDKVRMYYRARPIVLISKEFPRGSCEFNSVVEHENKHVKTLLKMHKKTAKEFRDYAQDVFLQARPVKIKSLMQLEAAEKKLAEQVNRQLNQKLLEINDRLAHEQIKVDSPSEYARADAQCRDWDKRLRLD